MWNLPHASGPLRSSRAPTAPRACTGCLEPALRGAGRGPRPICRLPGWGGPGCRAGPSAHAAALPDSLAPGAGAGRFGALPAPPRPLALPGALPVAPALGRAGPRPERRTGSRLSSALGGSGRHLAAALPPLAGLPRPSLPALHRLPSSQKEARGQPAPSPPPPGRTAPAPSGSLRWAPAGPR